MKTFSWLAFVVLAAVGGFVAGRGKLKEAGGRELEPARGWRETGRQPAKSGTQRRGAKAVESSGEGAKDARRVMVAQLVKASVLFGEPDPFDDNPSPGPERAKLYAAIYQATEDEFPSLFDLVIKTNEDGGTDWDHDLMSVMLVRWSELNPQAAWDWFRATLARSGKVDFALEAIVARTVAATQPGMALRMIEDSLVRSTRLAASEEWDPFGGQASLDGHDFFHQLVTHNPGFAMEALSQASDGLVEEAMSGWIQAMFELGRANEVPAALERFPAEERESYLWLYAERLIEQDHEAGRAWLDAGGNSEGGWDSLDLKIVGSEEVGTPQWVDAASWYLDRAGTEEERASRMYSLSLRLSPPERSDQYLSLLAEQGLDVSPARRGLFERALGRHDFDEAFRRLADVPVGEQDEALDRIFESSTSSDWINLGDEKITVFEPNGNASALAGQHGLGEAYRAYVSSQNQEAAGKILTWIQGQNTE